MKPNKNLRNLNRELARAAQTFAAAGFLPNPATVTSSAEPEPRASYSAANPTPMSMREMQRWLDAEAEVITKHQLDWLDNFYSQPAGTKSPDARSFT